ncbi:MAG: YicC family protein [Pseudomonadota bacterium]|nr:YicC family protein [Pseudomonadota bacterium]
MTGYANASTRPVSPSTAALHEPAGATAARPVPGPVFSVEMRSVNNRFLDLALRLPDELRALDPALRELVASRLKRGKVELRVTSPAETATSVVEPDDAQLARIARVERQVCELLPQARPLSVHEVLQLCRGNGRQDDASSSVMEAARECVAGLAEARAREGERLAAILRERVGHLRTLADAAEPLVPAAVARQQQRFLERWNEALVKAGNSAMLSKEAIAERALNEAAAYAIRIDVAEELARLRSHLDEIARLLDKGGEVGKRLEFLIQELLREANTLGSKSTTIEMTTISVDMKVAIEQLREQVQNVE